ncbi:MAG: hypothetical protein LBV00_05355 [Propionibacteriaceae bacterium]|jgi:hypothetical protein|nr:hypothetical protein [Propionibacteriaceae bacterium]
MFAATTDTDHERFTTVPALRAGHIIFDALRPATQTAWIHAVATIAKRMAA